jgi:hypothetical protein
LAAVWNIINGKKFNYWELLDDDDNSIPSWRKLRSWNLFKKLSVSLNRL